MKGFYLIAAVLAALPIHAATPRTRPSEVEIGPPARPAGGFRAEMLLGYDHRRIRATACSMAGGSATTSGSRRASCSASTASSTTSPPTRNSHLTPSRGRWSSRTGRTPMSAPARPWSCRATSASTAAPATPARGRASSSSINPAGQPLGPVGARNSYQDGYRVSAGGQLNIGRRAFLGAEYRYSNYEDGFFQREQLSERIGFRF